MQYQKYNAYKDSGVLWLGKIPEHWNIDKGKYSFRHKKEINKSMQCEDRLALTLNGVVERGIDDDAGLNPSDYKSYQIFEKDNLVFKLIDLENQKTSRVGLVHKKGIMSPAYIRIYPTTNLHVKYFYYQYFDLYQRYIFNELGTGVRSTLTYNDLLNIKVMIPPFNEQKSIAEFIDKKTSQIDTHIDKQERLVALLKEQRTAIINKAVTRGLDENVKLKDSGIDWLGEIPEHWEVRKVSRSFKKIGSGTTPTSGGELYYRDGDINWINTGDLNDGYLYECKNKVTKVALQHHTSLKLFPPDSLLVAMYGATIGKVAISKIDACVNQACCVLSESKYFMNEFAFYWFMGYRHIIIGLSYGGGQPNISQDTIKNLRIPVPPLNEQDTIVEYIKKQNIRVNETISTIEKEIAPLKEYRQSLISNAVTGKIKVI